MVNAECFDVYRRQLFALAAKFVFFDGMNPAVSVILPGNRIVFFSVRFLSLL
jgi:hypothetical protein